jgi:hypothetical protein
LQHCRDLLDSQYLIVKECCSLIVAIGFLHDNILQRPKRL